MRVGLRRKRCVLVTIASKRKDREPTVLPKFDEIFNRGRNFSTFTYRFEVIHTDDVRSVALAHFMNMFGTSVKENVSELVRCCHATLLQTYYIYIYMD